jgi:hypothetical protein
MTYQTIEIDKNMPTYLKIQSKVINTKNIEPLIELYKGRLFSNLIKSFTSDCINMFGTQIFSIKKSYSRTITNLLSGWMFSLYIDYDFSGDFFFPTNYNNTKSISDTLKDFCKYDPKIINPDEKINKVIINLKQNYKYQLELLNQYQKSNLFLNNKTRYRIKKTMLNIKKKTSEKEITHYKFDIDVDFVIIDKRLQNILKNILLPQKIYDKLVSIYTGPKNKVDEYLWGIIFRYQLLGSNNHQLAVLPNIMEEMNKDYKLNFECFASSINSTFPNYCSIYYDLEKYFGSVGSFYNMIPISGTFGINPPYQKDIIDYSIHKLFEYLDKTNQNLTFIITIPIWDLEGKNFMKQQFNNELEKQNIDYGEFNIIKEIKSSKYFKGLRMIQKEKFTYVDHNFDLYKNKTIQNTYVIILSNSQQNTNYLDTYDFEKCPIETEKSNEVNIDNEIEV